jgi:6-phosphogluconolactonase
MQGHVQHGGCGPPVPMAWSGYPRRAAGPRAGPIGPGGSLSLVPGGVVSSRGLLPDSLAVHGDLVYVANSGAGHSNYTGFRLGSGGHLSHIPGSTVTLASGAAPGDVLFNGTGTKLAGTEVGPSLIDSSTIGSGGRLTAAPGSPFPAQGLGPFGSEFRPDNPDQLFVSNAHNTRRRRARRHRHQPTASAGSDAARRY